MLTLTFALVTGLETVPFHTNWHIIIQKSLLAERVYYRDKLLSRLHSRLTKTKLERESCEQSLRDCIRKRLWALEFNTS